jgi:hypothetical protein
VDRLDIGMVDRDGDNASGRPKNPLRKSKPDWKPSTFSSHTRKKAIGEQMNHLECVASTHAKRKVPKAHKPRRSLGFKYNRDLWREETWQHAAKDADINGVIPHAPDMNVDGTNVEMDASKGLESHWCIFMNLGTPIIKWEVKRCQTALRAMITHGRWAFKNCPDVAIFDWWIKATLVAFINSLARTAHRLRDYAHRLLAFINRAEAIRKFNAMDSDLLGKLHSIAASTAVDLVGWTLNDINNALQAVYDSGRDLNYRQNPGKEHMLNWREETQQIFEGMIDWLRNVPSNANQAINSLPSEVKGRARKLWVLLRTPYAEIPEWPC